MLICNLQLHDELFKENGHIREAILTMLAIIIFANLNIA